MPVVPEEHALGLGHHGDDRPLKLSLRRQTAQVDERQILTAGDCERAIRLRSPGCFRPQKGGEDGRLVGAAEQNLLQPSLLMQPQPLRKQLQRQ